MSTTNDEVPTEQVAGPTALELPADLDQLPPDLATPVAAWFRHHGVDPDRVLPGTLVERDEVQQSLSWRELIDGQVRVRTRLPPVLRGRHWPARFPEAWCRHASPAVP
ncbi:hypothetical protein [Nocardioides plantarum]|uniref:Uncharacterized protein n=1 Tax=Nocardioides plantarum TaxID=29299 RepID=A0ABV5K7H0_9ACTN|nr:hypothetical protein [Nocardioides plantarum]